MIVFAFYLFAVTVCVSGLMVVLSRNPVHSVMWLILAGFNAAGLMILVGAEFIAMLLVIVYVGAVAVLFLFVVMMLDIDFTELRAGVARYFGIGLALAVALAAEVMIAIGALLVFGAPGFVADLKAAFSWWSATPSFSGSRGRPSFLACRCPTRWRWAP